MRQFVSEVDGDEDVSLGGAAALHVATGDVSRRTFEYIGIGGITFPYRKRRAVKTLVIAPPPPRPSAALRRHVVASIIK